MGVGSKRAVFKTEGSCLMKCFQDSYIYPTVLLEVLGLMKYQRHLVGICYLTFSYVACSMMSIYQMHYLRCLILEEYQGNTDCT